MAKNSIRDFDATSGNNTDIQSVDISEGCAASGINNAIRELMVDLKNVSTGAVNLETPAADQLDVDNIRIDGNTISSTDTNGDITLDPNGTGDTIIASGNLGVGEASPAELVHIKGASGAATDVQIQGGDDTNSVRLFMGGSTNRLNGRIVYDVTNDAMAVSTGGNERTRTGSGGMAIGATTVATNSYADINDDGAGLVLGTSSATNAGIQLRTGTNGNCNIYMGDNSGTDSGRFAGYVHYSNSSDAMILGTSSTSRLQIDSNGSTTTRTVSGHGSAVFKTSLSAGTASNLIQAQHSSSSMSNGTQCFFMTTNGNMYNTNNSYNGMSDSKLKENIVDATSQWDDIKALQVRKYNMIGDDTVQLGVVAQELEAAGMGGLVTTRADRDEDGVDLGTTTKSVKYSVLYMKAVKALQEAMTKIETLETKVAALEAAE